jgi:hypothetical protein
MASSARRAGIESLAAAMSEIALDRGSVLGLKGLEWRVHKLTLWNHDDVEAWRESTATKNLSD